MAKLFGQLLRRSEFARLAQPRHEIDSDVRAVEISADVEQVRLQRHRRIAKRRTGAKIHHPANRATRCLNPNRVYTFGRQKLPGRRWPEIQCGKSYRASTLCALNNSSADGIEAAEAGPRPLEIPARHRPTY